MNNKIEDKIKKINFLIQRAGTQGEKAAAIEAKKRLSKQLKIKKKEFTIYTPDTWHKKLLIAICRKHDIKPYRYSKQKYTTVMININEEYLNNIVWKEYSDLSELSELLALLL